MTSSKTDPFLNPVKKPVELRCPVTQLPFQQQPDWTGIKVGPDLRVTFFLIGENIVMCRLSGYATRAAAEKGLQLWRKYVSEKIPNRPYAFLMDFSALKGASTEARFYYIKTLKNNIDRQLVCLIFFGASAFMRLSIKLGIKMNERYNLKLTRNYPEAIQLALKAVQTIPANRSLPIGSEWKLQLDGFSLFYEIVDGEVLHVTLTGYLEEDHVEPMRQWREKIVQELASCQNRYFFILNLTGVTGTSASARRLLIRHIRSFYVSNVRRPVYIVYGASPLLKTIMNLARVLLPIKVIHVKDYEAALALIHQEKSTAPKPEEVRSGSPEIPRQHSIQQYVDELLDYLGNINWEGSGFHAEVEPIDPAHPFKPVFDAVALVKTEIDLLFQERKEAEEELRESEEKFKSLSQNTPDIIYTLDTHGSFTHVNPAWEKILGHKRKEVIGRDMADFVEESQREQVRNLFQKMDRTEIVRDQSVVLLNKTGAPRLFNLNGAPNYHSDGQLIGIVGILKDITDHRRLETQFQQAQKMEAIGTLAGGIAHDFNNLLMGIQGYVSLMLLNKEAGSPDYEKLKNIERQVQSGADLSRQLLGFARAGKYHIKPTDINEVVSQSAAMFGRTKKEIMVHEKLQPDIWTVEVDRGQIEQVLLNLYINAWQAMPAGGDLYLSTQNIVLEDDYTRALQMKSGHYVKITVTDTGIGMDEKTRKRIFEPFFTTKEMGRGTGLGLASAYGIIKGHGGLINVYSEKGHGSTFNIYLPASEKARPEEKPPEMEALPGRETILIVDDEEMVLKVSREVLEILGYTVMSSKYGRDAVAIYQDPANRIDLVILDMIMPEMSGREVFEELRKINPQVKVILSSGYSINGEASRIMESGCKAFIQKPFNLNQISQVVRKVLDV